MCFINKPKLDNGAYSVFKTFKSKRERRVRGGDEYHDCYLIFWAKIAGKTCLNDSFEEAVHTFALC